MALGQLPRGCPESGCPCIVFALRREAMFFRRTRPRRTFPGAPVSAAFHGESRRMMLLLETGVGIAAMEAALAWLLAGPVYDGAPYRPTTIVSAGFSGALVPGLSVGDLILAEDVCDADGRLWPTTWPTGATSQRRGRIVTVASLVGRPEDKRRLGARSGAVAVDMETAAVARLAATAGVPFGCLRAISDDADAPLSESLLAVLGAGRVRPGRLTAALLRRPAMIAELLRLRAHTQKAARRLAVGLEELLTPPTR